MIIQSRNMYLVALLFYPVFMYLLRRQPNSRKLKYTLLYLYLVLVFGQTLFPIMLGVADVITDKSKSIELDLFEHFVPRMAVLNVLLTMPFGFLFPLLFRHSGKVMVLVALLFPLLIESLQLVLLYVTPNYMRVFDISDLFFNALGVLAGYAVYGVIHIALRKTL